MTFTRRKFNRKFRGGKKKTIRKKRKTRRKRRGGMDPMGREKKLLPRAQTEEERLEEVRRRERRRQDKIMQEAKRQTRVALEEEPKKPDRIFGGKRKSKRRKSKRKKSNRKKRRKKKTKKRRRRKRQRGGMGQYNCVYPSNVGEIFTGIKLNKNPVLPDPINSNTNIRTSHKQKGGGFMDNWGMGDALLGWYKGTNAVSNVPIRYKGGKALMNANPMHQPGLLKENPIHKTANIPVMYRSASDKAVDAKFTVN